MAKHSPFPVLTLEPLGINQTPLIDVRSAVEFAAGHPLYATSIPLDVIEASWHELPPKGASIKLLCNLKQQDNLQQIFESQNYSVAEILVAEKQKQQDWIQGDTSQRLWRANPLLEQNIGLIKDHLTTKTPLVFDVGAGSGRDSIFLSLHGFKAMAFDNNRYALDRLGNFSDRAQANIQGINLNFQTQLESFQTLLEQHKPQLVMQARYLHRPLLDLYYQYLPKGAMVAIHTFTQAAAEFGKPRNPAYLLQDNELIDKFSDWEILLNQTHKLDDGRPLSMFLAQKPE